MKSIRNRLLRLSDIPRDLDSVSTIDKAAEVAPESVGLGADDIDHIWRQVRALYRSGTHPAITVSIRHEGKVIMSRAIGHASGNGPGEGSDAPKVLATPDTPICLYSSSKAVTAVLMHMLVEDGLINLMDPVAFYAPEFARNGKANITIHQILAHRGGIPGLPKGALLDVLWDEDKTWELLCDARPITTDGSKLAYHAITGGFVLDRVVRKVTGGNMNALIEHKLRQPMAMKYFTYGIEPKYSADLAPTYATGPRQGPLLTAMVKRALGADLNTVVDACNDPRFQSIPIPAGNLISSASELSAFYQMMLNGGKWGRRRICAESTVARAVQEFGGRTLDRTLGIPMRYSAGLMLGDTPVGAWGARSRYAYGHLGLINKFGWADPQRALSVALLTTGLPLISHHVVPLINTIRAISGVVPPGDTPPGFHLRSA